MIGLLTKSGRAFGRLARVLRMTEEKLAAADARIEALGREADKDALKSHSTIQGLESAMLSDLDFESEVLRASDRLEALADEFKRRGRPYPATRLIWTVRQVQDLVGSETAWRRSHKPEQPGRLDAEHPVLAIIGQGDNRREIRG
jgi:hypothetical protein